MPRMDKTGPEGKGPASGRKLGFCRKAETNFNESGTLGIGLGKRFHAPDKHWGGKGKRLRYFQNKQL